MYVSEDCIRHFKLNHKGIYSIVNIVTGQLYVGSSYQMDRRKSNHFSNLRNNCHLNKQLQRDFNKYGAFAFEFKVIERVNDITSLLEREQYWIDELKSFINGYNHEAIARRYKKK